MQNLTGIINMITSIGITAYLIAGIIYFGNKKTGYNHYKHTISELAETGSAFKKQVSFGLFLPVGLALLYISFTHNQHETIRGISAALGAGYVIAAFLPCDKGSPSWGTGKQQLHNLGGFIEYAGSIYFLLKAGEDDTSFLGINFNIIGFIVAACIIITSIPGNPVRGLAQRLAELLLFAALIYLLFGYTGM